MAHATRGGGFIIIGTTIFIALVLTLIPLPDWLQSLRPEWLALVLIYWGMALPQRIGVGSAFCCGLILDILRGAVLGQHALALVIIIFLTHKVYQQIRVYPMWQQALSITGLLLLYHVMILWVNGMMGVHSRGWGFWLPVFTSTLMWPWIYLLLRDIRRNFGIK